MHSRVARINERLRQAVAGNAHPRCILLFESPSLKYRTNKKHRPKAALFIGGLEEIRLHSRGARINERLRQAVAGNAHPRCILLFESPSRKYRINKKHRPKAVLFVGGLEEIRTPDPHNANVVRYHPVK